MRVLLLLPLAGCALFARPLEVQGEHLRIVGDTFTSSPEEMEALLALGESFHGALAELYPADVTLDPEVRVELHGRFRNESPYVDIDGTVHLWRFSDGEGGYRAMYAHELVHAMDFDETIAAGEPEWEHFGFYSEGWAEYAALTVDPEKTGFPLFGFSEDVVVGHWIQHGGLSLASLRANHEALNMPCQFQGYIMRASWFRYIDETRGREVLLDLVAPREDLTPAVVEAALGEPLEQVDAGWRDWALDRYDAYDGADAEAAAYRERISFVEPCVE